MVSSRGGDCDAGSPPTLLPLNHHSMGASFVTTGLGRSGLVMTESERVPWAGGPSIIGIIALRFSSKVLLFSFKVLLFSYSGSSDVGRLLR